MIGGRARCQGVCLSPMGTSSVSVEDCDLISENGLVSWTARAVCCLLSIFCASCSGPFWWLMGAVLDSYPRASMWDHTKAAHIGWPSWWSVGLVCRLPKFEPGHEEVMPRPTIHHKATLASGSCSISERSCDSPFAFFLVKSRL